MNTKQVIKIVLLFAMGFLSLAAPAQDLNADKVPAVVTQAFHAKFPTVKHAGWKIKSDKNYEAEFRVNGTEIAAKFDVTGKWLETESAIPRTTVPQAVRGTVARQFEGYKVIETQSVQRWNEERLIYELHLENYAQIVKAQFLDDGTILNQSTKLKAARRK
jgi:hypothetical protein